MTACPLCQRPLYEKRDDVVPRPEDDRSCRSALVGVAETLECHSIALERLVAKEPPLAPEKPL